MDKNTPIEKIFRLKKTQKDALKRMGLLTARDLLFHFPARYHGIAERKKIADITEGEDVTVFGKITRTKITKAFRKNIPIAEIAIEDGSGTLKATWFHQAYIAKQLKEGETVQLSGKVTKNSSGLYLANPEFERMKDLPIDVGDSLFQKEDPLMGAIPVYPERRGITSRWFYHAVQNILGKGILDEFEDPIPEAILKKYHLPTLHSALVWIHSPRRESDGTAARKRFAFQEIFFIQIKRQIAKRMYREHPSFHIKVPQKQITEFTKRFGFELTGAQKKSIKSILSDFKKDFAMTRLLEGDVGSGKTAVAATTAYAVVTTRPEGQSFGNLQVAYMAPTEILAKQLFESFVEYFENLPVQIGLMTGSGCKKFPSKVNPKEPTSISRTQLLKWIKNGEIPILIGTHALIAKKVEFENLAYVIIDEQHRFGTAQRQKLVRKDGIAPHLLSMTATPIPRTLALTIYGDLDLTILDEVPANRLPPITEIVLPGKRKKVYEHIREKLEAGQQVYVICPRINEPDPEKERALNVKSVKEEAKRLAKEEFKDYTIDILHSNMKPAEKEDVMHRFEKNEVNILVSTSVVEVGINVPNATTIIIEGAERFGLAQLHQLRGRVLRSSHQAHCYIFSDSKTKTSVDRLKALAGAKNGFELAEIDLELRGAGLLGGKKQWGVSDVGMEAIKNINLVEAARNEATALIEKDPELGAFPHIKKIMDRNEVEVHFE